LYRYFLDNEQTERHESFIVGIRELTLDEDFNYCSNNLSMNILPVTDNRYNFTCDYELRIYSSGCYYLNENNEWQSDGLRVGSQTNHDETECFTKHLTTFADGFIVLPSPINWSYVFANMDFMRNKTIYLTLIIISSIYILLMIFARYKDKKDVEKLGVTTYCFHWSTVEFRNEISSSFYSVR